MAKGLPGQKALALAKADVSPVEAPARSESF